MYSLEVEKHMGEKALSLLWATLRRLLFSQPSNQHRKATQRHTLYCVLGQYNESCLKHATPAFG